jgi:pimeloyl-ACP methyl ester carboxylesterase
VHLPSSDGVRLALHELGGDGTPLLICHATGFCGRAYEPLAEALAAHHRVWALDARGHGESSPPDDGDQDWLRIVDDVLVAIDAIGAPVHLVGHSMGGAVGLAAEARRPGLLRSAYLFEPIIFPRAVELPAGVEPGPNPMAEAARRRRATFPSRAEARQRYGSRPPLSALDPRALDAYVAYGFEELPDGTVALRCRPEVEADTFESAGSITVDTVRGVAPPVVIARGGEHGSPIADGSPVVAAAVRQGRVETFDDLGHFGPLEAPEAIAADVLALTHG